MGLSKHFKIITSLFCKEYAYAKYVSFEYYSFQVMQFGRIDNNAYTLDFQYPFTAVQAFAVALANVTQRLKWFNAIKSLRFDIKILTLYWNKKCSLFVRFYKFYNDYCKIIRMPNQRKVYDNQYFVVFVKM